MKRLFIISATICSVAFWLILLFSMAVSVHEYFSGSVLLGDAYPLFCEILYGEILKYDVLLAVVFFAFAFIQEVIDWRKEA